MTGLSFAGEILAPYAVDIGIRLTRRLGIDRWRIDRMVRKQTNISYPGREFKKWLRSLGEETWRMPVEVAAPRLAVQLDGHLSDSGAVWTQNNSRLSLAFRMVQATYAANLEIVGAGEGNALMEQWASYRNATIMESLHNLARKQAGWSSINASDHAWILKRQSWARRSLRIKAAGVPDEHLRALIDGLSITPIRIDFTRFRAITGAFGAGKSEAAEAWHMSKILEYESSSKAQIPLWISARELQARPLEAVIGGYVGNRSDAQSLGVAVVIDGLDELPGADVDAVIRDAKIYLAGSAASQVLATSRIPGSLADHECTDAAELSSNQIAFIMELITGSHYSHHSWPESLQTSIRRPFFALAAASVIASGQSPGSHASLIRMLVENAISRGRDQGILQSDELFGSLIKLASDITDHQATTGIFDVRVKHQLISTRLVHWNGTRLSFSLPVFEQWFASQALLDETSRVRLDSLSPVKFDSWRWPIAITLTIGPPKVVDDLVAELLELNPGAAAWVLSQAISNDFAAGYTLQEEQDVPARALRSARKWIDGFGLAANLVFKKSSRGSGIRLGVTIREDWLTIAWSVNPGASDEVVELDSIPAWDTFSEWQSYSSFRVGDGPLWPWRYLMQMTSRELGSVLKSDAVLADGIWKVELQYNYCRKIVGANPTHSPMSSVTIISKIDRWISMVPPDDLMNASFGFGGVTVRLDILLDLRNWLYSLNGADVARPLPAPDKPPGQATRWVWSLYSPGRLLELAAETHGRAYDAYEEIADSAFDRFSWTLAGNSYRPVGVIGVVAAEADLGPVVSYHEVPLSVLGQIVDAEPGVYCISGNRRAAFKIGTITEAEELQQEISSRLASLQSVESTSPFRRLTRGWSRQDVSGNRLSSAAAADWIYADLHQLGLASGGRPSVNMR